MNSYHTNIKVTIEINTAKFLDTKISRNDEEITCNVKQKEHKLPFHWSSAVPKNYKRNLITGDLHRASKISSNIEHEIKIIKSKYIKAGYPLAFISSVIDTFHQEKEDFIIPPSLFEERKEVYFQIPFCRQNEFQVKTIIQKLDYFTGNNVKFRYYWKTRKVRSLFPLKDLVIHKTNVIYKGTCSCKDFYIGETKRNADIRWREHGSLKKSSEVGDHLLANPGHTITWQILTNAPKQSYKRKILEAFFLTKLKPPLNNQKDIKFTS